eukprot:5502271-Pyramimonas_sp.AAC.1
MGHLVVAAGLTARAAGSAGSKVHEKQFWICLRCGGWSQGRALKLAKQCLNPGQHPTKKGQE